MNIEEGIYLIDKPAGWTSFDVVAKIRNQIKKEVGQRVKVGHAGTLDPFATGLLIILSGPQTKNQAQYMKFDKEYEATLFLGATSTTGDPEGKISKKLKVNKVNKDVLEETLNLFRGESEQVPPQYSAIKVNGQRAYKLARMGEKVKLEPRRINIHDLKVISYKWPILEIKVSCSSGTYIRSLAEDIGNELGCGAYLTALRRTRVGIHSVDDAQAVESI